MQINLPFTSIGSGITRPETWGQQRTCRTTEEDIQWVITAVMQIRCCGSQLREAILFCFLFFDRILQTTSAQKTKWTICSFISINILQLLMVKDVLTRCFQCLGSVCVLTCGFSVIRCRCLHRILPQGMEEWLQKTGESSLLHSVVCVFLLFLAVCSLRLEHWCRLMLATLQFDVCGVLFSEGGAAAKRALQVEPLFRSKMLLGSLLFRKNTASNSRRLFFSFFKHLLRNRFRHPLFKYLIRCSSSLFQMKDPVKNSHLNEFASYAIRFD